MLDIITTFVQARLAVLKDNEGATATEYVLLVTLVALGITAGMIAFAAYLSGKFSGISW